MKMLIRVMNPAYFDETLQAIKGKEGLFETEEKAKRESWQWFQKNINKARVIPAALRNSTVLNTLLYNFVYASKNKIEILSVSKEIGEIVYDANTAPTPIESIYMTLSGFPGAKKLIEGLNRMIFEGHVQMWSKARKKEGWPKGILYLEPVKSQPGDVPSG
jgi:hypothetical protein